MTGPLTTGETPPLSTELQARWDPPAASEHTKFDECFLQIARNLLSVLLNRKSKY